MIILRNRYNTELPKEKREEFNRWMEKISKTTGHDAFEGMNDYDYQGLFLKSGGKVDVNQGTHFTDEFKKPNHPTFSTQSIYNGADGNVGGEWKPSTEPGKWIFVAGPANIKIWGSELQKYWDRHEAPAGNKLIIPSQDLAPVYPTMKEPGAL
jgi:hypothetical protein